MLTSHIEKDNYINIFFLNYLTLAGLTHLFSIHFYTDSYLNEFIVSKFPIFLFRFWVFSSSVVKKILLIQGWIDWLSYYYVFSLCDSDENIIWLNWTRSKHLHSSSKHADEETLIHLRQMKQVSSRMCWLVFSRATPSAVATDSRLRHEYETAW